MLDPHEERTSVVRSKLLNITAERMRGGPTPRVNQNGNGAPQLPPVGAGLSGHSQQRPSLGSNNSVPQVGVLPFEQARQQQQQQQQQPQKQQQRDDNWAQPPPHLSERRTLTPIAEKLEGLTPQERDRWLAEEKLHKLFGFPTQQVQDVPMYGPQFGAGFNPMMDGWGYNPMMGNSQQMFTAQQAVHAYRQAMMSVGQNMGQNQVEREGEGGMSDIGGGMGMGAGGARHPTVKTQVGPRKHPPPPRSWTKHLQGQ